MGNKTHKESSVLKKEEEKEPRVKENKKEAVTEGCIMPFLLSFCFPLILDRKRGAGNEIESVLFCCS